MSWPRLANGPDSGATNPILTVPPRRLTRAGSLNAFPAQPASISTASPTRRMAVTGRAAGGRRIARTLVEGSAARPPQRRHGDRHLDDSHSGPPRRRRPRSVSVPPIGLKSQHDGTMAVDAMVDPRA